ncbi:hypothetical protein PQX77_012957 [Marasmius sp. AFHP31]|nr:hypothetical protein PQX77_012957 [Marasmius sp. AFHP31]
MSKRGPSINSQNVPPNKRPRERDPVNQSPTRSGSRSRKPTAKRAAIDQSSEHARVKQLERMVASLTKDKQQQDDIIKKQKKRQERFEQNYYEEKGHSAPQSEDEDDEIGDSNSDNDGQGTLETGDLFPSSIRPLDTITNSPARPTPRKRADPAPVASMSTAPRLPTPPTQPNLRTSQTGPTPSTSTSRDPDKHQPSSEHDGHANGEEENEEDVPRYPPLRPGTEGNKLGDYCGLSKHIVKRCLRDYEAAIMGFEMFPNPDVHAVTCSNLWTIQNDNLVPHGEAPFTLTEEVMRLMGRRATRIRSAARDRIDPLITPMFRFKAAVDKDQSVSKNKRKYTLLSTDFGWYYRDPKHRTGYMKHPIITEAICKTLFYNKTAYGTTEAYKLAFSPLSTTALAFIFSLARVEHCLNQWSTGAYVRQELQEDRLEPLYRKHLARISEWRSLDESRTERVVRKWTDRGMAYAQVQEEDDIDVRMSKGDRENAIQELQNASSDSDGSTSDSGASNASEGFDDRVKRPRNTSAECSIAPASQAGGTRSESPPVESTDGSQDGGRGGKKKPGKEGHH